MLLHSPIHVVSQLPMSIFACVSRFKSPLVLLFEFGDDGVRKLLRSSLAAKVSSDSLTLRNRLSLNNG